MYYIFKENTITHYSDYRGNSFRAGEYWFKVFCDEDSFIREKNILEKTAACEGIVRMLDAGPIDKVSDDSDVKTYFAIKEEYVDGEMFSDYAKMHHGETKGIKFFYRLALILHGLEECGIIHNDIKPENIIVKEDGYPYVIDLNISKMIEAPVEAIHTHISQGFAAPEKNRQQITIESDVFSFGRLIKFYMDNNPDRGAASYSEAFHKVRTRCCMDNPSDRFHSFADVARELSEITTTEKSVEPQLAHGRNRINIADLVFRFKKAITILLLIISVFFLSLGTYMIFRPKEKEPVRIHANDPNLAEDCTIVITDIKNYLKQR